MKHPVESLHYSWVSTTTIVDTLWARLWCIHNPKILSWIGIGIGRYTMSNFPKGPPVTVYPNPVKNMQLILAWIVTWISLFYKYAKSEGPWHVNKFFFIFLTQIFKWAYEIWEMFYQVKNQVWKHCSVQKCFERFFSKIIKRLPSYLKMYVKNMKKSCKSISGQSCFLNSNVHTETPILMESSP